MTTVAIIMIILGIITAIITLIAITRAKRKKATAGHTEPQPSFAKPNKTYKTKNTRQAGVKKLEEISLHRGIINERPANMSFPDYKTYLRNQKIWIKARLQGRMVFPAKNGTFVGDTSKLKIL